MMQNAHGGADEIIIEQIDKAGIIRLNRPKAINSVTLPMVHAMRPALHAFAGDPAIHLVILTGEGERGLCAGGDVRVIHDLGKAGDADVSRFWRDEFPLNYAISHYPKPYVALMDGIVMGGGVGLSAHGQFRIVTERTRLAMPETGIGYFPDVGATWLLPKAPGECGTWLGLTGNSVGAADAIHAGLADKHVQSGQLKDLVQALSKATSADDVAVTIEQFSTEPEAGFLAANQRLIDEAFGFDRVEQIWSALERHDEPFAQDTLATMHKRSPTSLKLTLKLLRLGRESSGLVECLEREFRAGVEILKQHDFYEGVRAALVDKDRNPVWKPAELHEVSDSDIDHYLNSRAPVLFPDHRL
jgi:enoyl-CoA hydratase